MLVAFDSCTGISSSKRKMEINNFRMLLEYWLMQCSVLHCFIPGDDVQMFYPAAILIKRCMLW